jgi:hypothetical protein
LGTSRKEEDKRRGWGVLNMVEVLLYMCEDTMVKLLRIILKRVKGLRKRNRGDEFDQQCVPEWKCHDEALLYNVYTLIRRVNNQNPCIIPIPPLGPLLKIF